MSGEFVEDTKQQAPAIDLKVVDRTVERMDEDGLVWLSVGASRSLQEVVGRSLDPESQGTQLIRNDRDASFALIDRSDRRTQLHLWRGLYSAHDWFIATRSGGSVIVSDDFRSALASLPVEERTPNEDSVIQHYLFRTVFGTETYVQRIQRLGSGEHVVIDLSTGTSPFELVDKTQSETDLVGPENYLRVIEESLEATLESVTARNDVRLSFSGGVDSTLLATMMGPGPRLVTVVPDTPEFEVETAYARESADLMGVQLQEFAVSELSYLDLLESTICATGRPPVHDVVPFLATPYAANPGATFILGEGADGVYGIGGRAAKIAKHLSHPYIRAAMKGVARVTPADYRVRAEAVINRGGRLAADPWGPEGYAATSQVYGDPSFITRIVGQQRIEESLLKDLQYALDRVDMAVPSDPFYRHLELAQWRDTFADHIRPDGDAARSHGVKVVAPFVMSSSLAAVSRIPVPARHVKGYTGKWLMKEMLSARLPEYRVNQRKRHTSLPFMRYCTDGPLTDIWERYDTPDIFVGEDRNDLIENRHAESTLWNAIAYAIWLERVVRNGNLVPLAATESFSLHANDSVQ